MTKTVELLTMMAAINIVKKELDDKIIHKTKGVYLPDQEPKKLLSVPVLNEYSDLYLFLNEVAIGDLICFKKELPFDKKNIIISEGSGGHTFKIIWRKDGLILTVYEDFEE